MYLSVKQAAESLGVSEARIRQLLRSGRLAGYRAGPREWRVEGCLRVRPGSRGPKFGLTRKSRKATPKPSPRSI